APPCEETRQQAHRPFQDRRSHHIYNLEEHEARMDELEGTLRGHIGLIEESLERLEGKQITKGQKTEELYSKRGKDEKKEKK
ncbi:hypothetical protein D6C99_07467, partial [Aureobasidium pullulans]